MNHIKLFESFSDSTHPGYDEDDDFTEEEGLYDDEEDDDDFDSDEYRYAEAVLGDRSSRGAAFYSDCVGWNMSEIDVLNYIINEATQIQRADFLREVSASDMYILEGELGYRRSSLTMEKDYHVAYFVSKDFDDQTVYFFTHSAIEYCFMDEPETKEEPVEDDYFDFSDWDDDDAAETTQEPVSVV